MKEVPEYFSGLSDEQIDQDIVALTPYQQRIFDEKMKVRVNRRWALFVAKSYGKVEMPEHE